MSFVFVLVDTLMNILACRDLATGKLLRTMQGHTDLVMMMMMMIAILLSHH